MFDLIRAACQVTIYAAERILEALDAQRPLHDEPLPEGHTELWHDELWTPPGGRHPTLIFDTKPVDRSGLQRPLCPEFEAVHDHLMRRATTQWGRSANRWGGPPFDPRMN